MVSPVFYQRLCAALLLLFFPWSLFFAKEDNNIHLIVSGEQDGSDTELTELKEKVKNLQSDIVDLWHGDPPREQVSNALWGNLCREEQLKWFKGNLYSQHGGTIKEVWVASIGKEQTV